MSGLRVDGTFNYIHVYKVEFRLLIELQFLII